MLGPSDIASVAVAAIAALGMWASSRSAKKAMVQSTSISSKTDKEIAETEAYARARKLDIETIERQDREITEVREENHEIKLENMALRDHVKDLSDRTKTLSEKVRALEQVIANMQTNPHIQGEAP